MIIDDSPSDIEMLMETFRGEFALVAATSMDDGITILSSFDKPEVIILDINMPGMDGFDACDTIKNRPDLADIDILFLSSNDSTDSIIQGFGSGAVDYIVKPYNPEVLKIKIRNIIELRKKNKALQKSKDLADDLVHTVMSKSGSLGIVVNFLRSTFTVPTLKELLESTVDAFFLNGLNVVVYFKTDNFRDAMSSSGEPTLLEADLLDRLCGHEAPFIEHNGKLFIIQKHIVVLIKNFPEVEAKSSGLRDYAMILLEGANSRINQLANSSSRHIGNVRKLGESVYNAKHQLDDIHERHEKLKEKNIQVLDHMASSLEHSLFSMGLSDEQEKEISGIIGAGINETLSLIDDTIKTDDEIKNIIYNLSVAAQNAAQP